jgi:ABC-type enterochelin transport system substrate-binding protein
VLLKGVRRKEEDVKNKAMNVTLSCGQFSAMGLESRFAEI